MAQYGFYFDQTRCTGCLTCIIACKDWHEYDLGAEPEDWIKVSTIEKGKFPELFVAYLMRPCYQCSHPACLDACPVSAIVKREEDGIVTVDRETCLGEDSCGLCLEACYYQVPAFGPEPDKKMQKCDLCLERWSESKPPICVAACPMRALDAGSFDELQAKYGDIREGEGFTCFAELEPSIVFKPKLR
ncbi:4Fe-4S dicluster domain-containing protein [Chloroflexota bacterium]